MKQKIHNFNSGPAILSEEVFQEASRAVLNFNNSGLSILEIGHRTPAFIDVLQEARQLVKELMNLNDEYEVLFLHGGASTQFFQIPMNLLDRFETAAYTDTGVFAAKAIKEAKLFGNINVVCSSADKNYNYLPKDCIVPDDAKYLHITSNNTIYGTQWKVFPDANIPIVADMSSDILSREIDYNKFDLIYAGAQKNLGCAGVTIVVVKKNILGKVERDIPTMMDYRMHIKENSLLNTAPVFAIYVAYLNLKWLKNTGGVEQKEILNRKKSELIYAEIDRNKMFTGTTEIEDRSMMNACFVAKDEKTEKSFLEYCKEKNIYGIKGHRLAAGFRASMYNALPLESVEYLVRVMQDFESLS